jgi:RNA polymerase sigma-70 factor (ECF subfamily)
MPGSSAVSEAAEAQRPAPEACSATARIAEAYRQHYERLVGMCFRRLRDLSAAEDAAHEAFARAIAAGDHVIDHVGWLYTVAANICTDELRRRARRRTATGEVEVELTGSPDESALSAISMRELLGQLPRQERAVLAARVQEDLSYTAIARRMGISESAVGVALHRARKHVAALLAAQVA